MNKFWSNSEGLIMTDVVFKNNICFVSLDALYSFGDDKTFVC